MLNKDEFLHHCKDGAPLWPIIIYAESVIKEHECFVSYRYNEYRSLYDSSDRHVRWFIGYLEKCIILKAEDVVSDLFHEIGHMLQEPLKAGDSASIEGSCAQFKRENKAWDIGKNILRNCDLVNEAFLLAFNARKEHCRNENKKYGDYLKNVLDV